MYVHLVCGGCAVRGPRSVIGTLTLYDGKKKLKKKNLLNPIRPLPMASFWSKKSEPSSTWSVGTNPSIGSTHQTTKNVNSMVIRLYKKKATDPKLWMVLMQLDQQVAFDLNFSNADDGTVSLSIGGAVACRSIAKLNFVLDWSCEPYRKCNCTQLVLRVSKPSWLSLRSHAQFLEQGEDRAVPIPDGDAGRSLSGTGSTLDARWDKPQHRKHAWDHEDRAHLRGHYTETEQCNIVVEFVVLLQLDRAASCNQLDVCNGDYRTVSRSIGAAVTVWNLDPDALPCVKLPTIVAIINDAFNGCKLSFSK